MKCPCRGCTDRTLTCHGVGERFAEWKKYEADRKAWLATFKPPVSEQARNGEIEKLRRKKRGKSGKYGGRTNNYE